jgi:hypothetical protein
VYFFREADAKLTLAYNNCLPSGNLKNIKNILESLIPVKMLLGIMPGEDVLKYFATGKQIEISAIR